MTSVTRLGDFWKFLATNLLSIVFQIFRDFLGCIEKHHFSVKLAVATFRGNFWKHSVYFLFQHLVSLVMTTFLSRHYYIAPVRTNNTDFPLKSIASNLDKGDVIRSLSTAFFVDVLLLLLLINYSPKETILWYYYRTNQQIMKRNLKNILKVYNHLLVNVIRRQKVHPLISLCKTFWPI